MNNCPFCNATRKHISTKPKTKHYEIGEGNNTEIVSTALSVMHCRACDTRWIKYKQIQDAIKNHEKDATKS